MILCPLLDEFLKELMYYNMSKSSTDVKDIEKSLVKLRFFQIYLVFNLSGHFFICYHKKIVKYKDNF